MSSRIVGLLLGASKDAPPGRHGPATPPFDRLHPVRDAVPRLNGSVAPGCIPDREYPTSIPRAGAQCGGPLACTTAASHP